MKNAAAFGSRELVVASSGGRAGCKRRISRGRQRKKHSSSFKGICIFSLYNMIGVPSTQILVPWFHSRKGYLLLVVLVVVLFMVEAVISTLSYLVRTGTCFFILLRWRERRELWFASSGFWMCDREC
jgi:hypothetical protein